MEIEFKPLTEGLGFHATMDEPFVPKSPARTSQSVVQNMGAGAVSAGPATFARSLPSPSTQSRSVVPAERVSLTSAPTPPLVPLDNEPWRPSAIYPFQRLMAFCMDMIVGGIFFLGVISGLVTNQLVTPELFLDWTVLAASIVACLTVCWALLVAQEVIFKSSIGKRIFRLYLMGNRVNILIRGILFIPSTLFLGAGLIWGLLDSSKCCLHDRLSGVQPIDF